MQEAMGAYGIVSQFRPPLANYMYSKLPIILNALPEMRQHYAEDAYLNHSRTAAQYADMIDDALLRYMGQHAEVEANARKELWNPVSWFRAGVELLLVSPLFLLSAFGLMPVRLIQRLRRGGLFRATLPLLHSSPLSPRLWPLSLMDRMLGRRSVGGWGAPLNRSRRVARQRHDH